MKYFVVPEPVTLVNTITKEPLKYDDTHPLKGQPVVWSAHKFLVDNILSSPKIGKGHEAIRRVYRLDQLFDKSAPGDILGIEELDFAVCATIISEMEFATPLVAAQLMPFFDAWENVGKQDEKWKRDQSLKSLPEDASA